jgi:ubiquinone biosynthesis protein Coq4
LNSGHSAPALLPCAPPFAALRSDPAIAPLIRERYRGHWPSQAELQAGSDGDDTWLHQRVRHTHDLWHVVCGCPPTPAGEAAMSAVNVMQLHWPGSAMLQGADLLHRCLEGPVSGEVDVGQAVSYGLEQGWVCAPLLAQRWEQLGITALVKRSPIRTETSRA